jgi:hypothetical protein
MVFNAFLFVINTVLTLAMLKLYTEAFKELRHDRRERDTRPALPG